MDFCVSIGPMIKKVKSKRKKAQLVECCTNIYPYVKQYLFRTIVAIFITVPVGIMDAIIAWSLKPYMDIVMLQKNIASSSHIPVMIIGFSFIQSIFNYLSNYMNAWVGMRIGCDLKYDLFRKLLQYESAFFDRNTSGVIQTRFNADVDAACSGLMNHMKLFSTRFFSSLSLLAVLFINSLSLALVAFTILFISMYPLTTIRRRISNIMHKTIFSGAAVITHYMEAFQGNRIIAAYNLKKYQIRKFFKTLTDVFHLEMKMAKRTGMLSPVMHFVISIGIALIIWLGSHMIINNRLTIGEFVSFITALLMLYQPIKSIGNDYNALQRSILAIDRVFNQLREATNMDANPNGIKLSAVTNTIEYKNVCFAYQKDRPVLQNVCFSVKVGETVAFVGNSGGGKTTIVNLLPRFYDVTSGEILLNGLSIRDYSLESLRDKISVVFQESFLFSGSIRENILIGRYNASEEQLKVAIKSSCLEEFVSSLPNGLDTEAGERGVMLSGGQKQRIAIARAFLKNAPILILDEATSALDAKSEAVVQKALDNLMKNRTVFMVSHRLSTIKNADYIIVINDGEVVESGSHDYLMQRNGAYASLHRAQSL
ncbi:MAG: ABC transporter ATP-binding protein/permease [Holosporaceae bacterium]|nr:ABC transporter ATP-binding protein/permease [Holosporaceae bacterium]